MRLGLTSRRQKALIKRVLKKTGTGLSTFNYYKRQRSLQFKRLFFTQHSDNSDALSVIYDQENRSTARLAASAIKLKAAFVNKKLTD